uniref:Uncharacterized protein n=1 Tax=Ixodes ricinus TaxID=34613 RepID=A0A6B0UGS5_IXORI
MLQKKNENAVGFFVFLFVCSDLLSDSRKQELVALAIRRIGYDCVSFSHSSGRVGWTNHRLCSCFLLSVTAADVFAEFVCDAQRKKRDMSLKSVPPHATDQGSLSLF